LRISVWYRLERVLYFFVSKVNNKPRQLKIKLIGKHSAEDLQLDYLVGATDILLEKSIVNRVLDIQKLKENDKQHVFALLDAFIKQTKLQSIM